MYRYPANYGAAACYPWDELLEPDCADAAGMPLADAKAFCPLSWCYVDPDTCDAPDLFQSALNPDLSYSYSICGNIYDPADDDEPHAYSTLYRLVHSLIAGDAE